MAEALLTGATGVLGRHLHRTLEEAGYAVRPASRSPPDAGWVSLDLATGEGVRAAVDGVDHVVHAASDARGDPQAVDVRGIARLLEAAETAGIERFVYVSIVGIDEIPYSYYEAKLDAEGIVRSGSVSSTIVRATQFHAFVAYLLDRVSRLPIWPLPTRVRLQPIAAADAARAIVRELDRSGGPELVAVGGPEIHTVRALAQEYRAARGLYRPIVPLPVPGAIASAFRSGAATCPDRRVGEQTWAAWLEEASGVPGRGRY